ncbi:MAG: hypothetical protein JSV05_02520 [Candidatus Bathyarchaeota archaeon]|nr:MAG: hypothetical protein JSV05_02520 [Candidatus Bathyarchaeota archaeon]
MIRRKTLTVLLTLFCLTLVPLIVDAATIPSCSFNRDIYTQGDTGYITITVVNDEESTIRITDGYATVDYYYVDGDTYLQTFYTDTILPIEIEPGQNSSFYVSFNLPSNIAPGYTTFYVKAITQIWNSQSELWFPSSHPSYELRIYVESSYKQQYEDQQTANELLQGQMQELQAITDLNTNIMYLLGLTTAIFLVVTIFLVVLNRKPRAVPKPVV